MHSKTRGRDFPCRVRGCSYVATKHANLKMHRCNKHAENGSCKFLCDMAGCSYVTNKQRNLYDHVSKKHNRSDGRDLQHVISGGPKVATEGGVHDTPRASSVRADAAVQSVGLHRQSNTQDAEGVTRDICSNIPSGSRVAKVRRPLIMHQKPSGTDGCELPNEIPVLFP
eukprot:gnl/TRDRNA2_/TRDRNA2_132943_c1_seq1.p1 gnl/TRDRNA2_/TRDRNA2_132943_c1~~gnl/TRDRNA2_/TRDRNA2_132943_c1_seq1.p1  ORF type:complete len:169 (-),score=11.70 gnl/TRDRNA2_/TRDRNA2_132943_c1_seq1:218-724(-)